MSRFVQLHFLTSYAPSNLNRDDLGRPKTALFGGSQRLRVSSQSLKRAWRVSELFEQELEGHIGTRTKDFGNIVYRIVKETLEPEKAHEISRTVAAAFGKLASDGAETEEKRRRIEQLAHITPGEKAALEALALTLAKEKRGPKEDELAALVSEARGAADIALFGRMLASKPKFNVEAAAQVAHALSVHKVAIEDDYFTAVDDLNTDEDSGAGHVGTHEYAAALLYHYVCVDTEKLKENLGGDVELANRTLSALIKACLTVSPTGKQASYASVARASYALVERGEYQPRSLAVAFLEPLRPSMKHGSLLDLAIERLIDTRTNFEQVYEEKSASKDLNASKGAGSISELVRFATGA